MAHTMKIYILTALLALVPGISWADDPDFSQWGVPHVPQILKDPKTGVVFYLESDRRHVSAIAPDGKLLWCSEVVIPPDKNRHGIRALGIYDIRFIHLKDPGVGAGKADDYLRVNIFGEGFGSESIDINKKTGKPGIQAEVS